MEALTASLTSLLFLLFTMLRDAAIIYLLVGGFTFAACVVFPTLGNFLVRLLRVAGLD